MLKLTPEVFDPWHYTTENCAVFLKKYLTAGQSVLDIGTGSGILAIKAREYGAGKITAVDIKPKAVALASENCRDLDIEVKEGYLNWNTDGKYDITIANLDPAPAAEFIQFAANTMSENGILILTWDEHLSFLILEQYFDILERTTGLPFNTFVLKTKQH